MALNIFLKYNMKKRKKLSIKNSRILHDTMVTLGALKEQTKLNNLPIHEIQVHLLDKDGDGIVLCLEYDELTGELNRTFYDVDEYYATEEDDIEVELDSCISPENIKTRFEEVISEEYDEIFHSAESFNGKKRSRLLN